MTEQISADNSVGRGLNEIAPDVVRVVPDRHRYDNVEPMTAEEINELRAMGRVVVNSLRPDSDPWDM